MQTEVAIGALSPKKSSPKGPKRASSTSTTSPMSKDWCGTCGQQNDSPVTQRDFISTLQELPMTTIYPEPYKKSS